MTFRQERSRRTISREMNEAEMIRNLSLVSLTGNIMLSGLKMSAGIAGNSGAMISDSIHSLSDVLATAIAWIGVRVSKKGPDHSHPYGHERLECAASLILGLVLLITGIGVGRAGVEKILSGNAETLAVPGLIALAAAVVSIIVKEAMFWYTRYYAKLIHSAAFMADAWHHRSDALASVGSLIGITGAMMGFPVLDCAAGVVICFFIVKVACDIIKDAFIKMLDTSRGEEYEQSLRECILSQKDVARVDLLHSRMFGNKTYIDLEISVDGDKSLWEAHEVAECVHREVEQRFSDIKHIMIHVNPIRITANKCS